jgi:ketosteroid isomerase-like protein
MSSTTVTSNHKRVVEAANAAFARNDMEAFLGLCSDNLEWTMVGDTTVRGKQAIREWMKSMDPGTPSIKVDQIVTDGDTAIATGSFRMKDKSGRDASYEYCDVYSFQGDRIASLKAYVIKADRKGESAP